MRTSGGGGGVVSDFGHPRTRGGGGSKKDKFLRTSFMDGPLSVYMYFKSSGLIIMFVYFRVSFCLFVRIINAA